MNRERKTYIKAAINILTVAVALLLCVWLLPKFIVFFMPFILGWIISLLAAPLVRFFEEKIKIKRKAGTAFVIILVLAVVILIVYAVVYFLVQELMKFINDFPEMWAAIGTEINSAGNNMQRFINRLPVDFQKNIYGIADIVKEYFSGLVKADNSSAEAVTRVGNIVSSIPDIIMSVVITLLSSYFFVAEKDYVNEFSEKYVPGAIRYRWDMIKRSVQSAFGGYFKAQFKIEVWIYVITAIGLLILQTRYALLVALGVAFLDFLPVFGAGAVMIPWAIVELFGAEYGKAIGLLIVWGIGQLVRQIIQPKIVGDSIGVDAIPTLFLLYIGFKFGGVFGMIIAVPIGIILHNLYEEGVFNTTIESFRILFAGFNRFRKIREEDIKVVEQYVNELPENYRGEVSKPDNEKCDDENK